MADTDRPIDEAAPDHPIRQGEPTYAPEDLSEAARRSKWREVHDQRDPAPPSEDGV